MIDRWRWLCTECNAEGRGTSPDECPTCGCEDAWYETNTASDIARPMSQIFDNFKKRFRKKPQ